MVINVKTVIATVCGVFLMGCSSYSPVADLRVSKDASLFQRDVMECENLVLDVGGWYSWYPLQPKSDYANMVDDCLTRRGHSIISANKY